MPLSILSNLLSQPCDLFNTHYFPTVRSVLMTWRYHELIIEHFLLQSASWSMREIVISSSLQYTSVQSLSTVEDSIQSWGLGRRCQEVWIIVLPEIETHSMRRISTTRLTSAILLVCSRCKHRRYYNVCVECIFSEKLSISPLPARNLLRKSLRRCAWRPSKTMFIPISLQLGFFAVRCMNDFVRKWEDEYAQC